MQFKLNRESRSHINQAEEHMELFLCSDKNHWINNRIKHSKASCILLFYALSALGQQDAYSSVSMSEMNGFFLLIDLVSSAMHS